MLHRTRQSIARLLSIGAISLGTFISGAGLVLPPVPVALAAESASADGGEAGGSPEDTPQTNPYADPTQCIHRVWELAAQAGHKLPWFEGNAADWKAGATEHGFQVADCIAPDVVHSVAVWDAGAGGASWAGHVGWVVEVEGDRFLVQDRNWVPAADDERWVTWEEGISFIKLEQPAPAASTPTATPATMPQATRAEEPRSPLQSAQVLDPLRVAHDASQHLLQPWSLDQLAAPSWASLTLDGAVSSLA